MWIQIRTMDGKKVERLDGLSKLTKIEELRERLVDPFEAPLSQQKLFYRGKILVDGHSLFDYDVGLNAIVQLLVTKAPPQVKSEDIAEKNEKKTQEAESSGEEENVDKENMAPSQIPTETPEPVPSQDSGIGDEASTYKVGDIIDCRDEEMGAWFEAKIMKIERNIPNTDVDNVNSDIKQEAEMEKTDQNANEKLEDDKTDTEQEAMKTESSSDKKTEKSDENCDQGGEKTENTMVKTEIPNKNPAVLESTLDDDGFTYCVVFEGYDEDDFAKVPVRNVRPRARNKIKFDNLKEGDRVMLNHNYDEPDSRGYWYDAVITSKRNTRTIKELNATVFIGKDLIPMENCVILYRDEVFAIEKPGTQLNVNKPSDMALSPVKRTNKPECDHCQDNPRRKCKECACSKCGDKKDPDKQILCDECDQAYHIYCLSPPLDAIPEDDEWYCPECKNDASEVVGAGQKLKESKKKSKMASATNQGSSRDWGKGMACVGRTKMCTIVPSNHFGPIPGIEVGTLWLYRVQVSEAGVHRPHVAGIHGREEEGAYSIALSGGYEDDHDEGERFYYTGSGGRDLSGNKRTAEQSCDQTLTRFNKALARNCAASLSNEGADAGKDWRKGKPVRVVRNAKLSKHSKYAPDEGNRYDGIYKVKKYWPEKGKSGFKVWRFLFQRDDQTPAPWTRDGKKRVEELGLVMQYPEGHEEMLAKKEKEKREKEMEKEEKTPSGKGKRGKRKRQLDSDNESEEEKKVSPKRAKKTGYKVATAVMDDIKRDEKNEKVWEEALGQTKEGAQTFLAKVEELFCCICCQDLVVHPITVECSHNLCKSCLQRSFKAEVYSCPACRTELDKNMAMGENKALRSALKALFPGYESGR